ncbi:MAG: Na+/H+ antiporter NhaA [Campylobacterales bacterium]|nr:Na+/H+ antiporter NhaA [Campylobacterales bacterium]
MKEKLYKVFNNDTAGGILLIMATLLAMIIVNIPLLSPFYDKLITMPIEIWVGDFELANSLLLWVNDGLMAIFFLALRYRRILGSQTITQHKGLTVMMLNSIRDCTNSLLVEFGYHLLLKIITRIKI